MNLIIRIVIYAIGIFIASSILPGVQVGGFGELIVVAIVLILLQTFVKPIFMFFAFPINFLTLGLFTFIINAAIIEIADALLGGFNVEGLGWAILFSLILSIIVSLLESFDKK